MSKAGSQGDGQILPSPDVPVVETVDDPHQVTVFFASAIGGSVTLGVPTPRWQ